MGERWAEGEETAGGPQRTSNPRRSEQTSQNGASGLLHHRPQVEFPFPHEVSSLVMRQPQEDQGKFGLTAYKWRGIQCRPQSLRSQDTTTTGQLMNMRGALCWVPGLLLLGHAGWLCSAEDITPITGTQGASVLLTPVLPAGFKPREVFWRHLSPTDHLVASFSRGSRDTTYQSCFHGRADLLQNFTLRISGLQLRDTGMFTCQMVDIEGRLRLHQFYLTVYEEASTPEVQVYVSRQNTDCAVFLSCNVTTGNNLTYSWVTDTGQGGLPNNTYRLYDDGRLLQMTLTSTHQDVSFACVVTNPVSQGHAAVIPWASCSAQLGQEEKINNGKVVIFIAASLIIMFTTGMICVYFFTRSSGKTPVNRREKTNMNTEETILQLQEETEALENEQRGLHHHQEAAARHSEDMTLGYNSERGSNEVKTARFSAEKTVIYNVETVV